MPTWLLVGGVVLALGGSAWLFVAERGTDEPDPATSTTPESEDREGVEGVLVLPDEDAADEDDAADGDDEDAGDDETASALVSNLRGRRIALAAASAPAPGDAARLVRVDALRLPCAARADVDRLGAEDAFVAAMRTQLEQAGAVVSRADEPAACVDSRARRLQRAELAVVVGASGTGDAAVFAGLPTRGSVTSRASSALADELAAALGLDAATSARSPADLRRRVLASGGLDVSGGSAVALVELDEPRLGDDVREDTATALVEALALVASRADVAAG